MALLYRSGFRVSGLGFRVWGLGFLLGFMSWTINSPTFLYRSGVRVSGFGSLVSLWVSGFAVGISGIALGAGFRGWGFRV